MLSYRYPVDIHVDKPLFLREGIRNHIRNPEKLSQPKTKRKARYNTKRQSAPIIARASLLLQLLLTPVL